MIQNVKGSTFKVYLYIHLYILDNLKVISYSTFVHVGPFDIMIKSQQGFDDYSNLHIMPCTFNLISIILLQMYMHMNPLS